MIEMDKVVKVYPGATEPAIKDLSFKVDEGETCVVIGPSGCGKTTTLKMINRLIEPTGGRILIQDENVLDRNPVELRRGIGYVIQQIGLFPHMTIAENISVVPRLLGWEKERMHKRVDDLIEMVGMDPADFRGRFPRQLSGGQRQRIGVARALAADPPILLMDEPFGAIDPITRDRLQNEFLRLQKRLKKTITFVTHDIDEALKMGTVICILYKGGIMAQFDTPENLLAKPANDFVRDFVGADRGLKRLNLVRVGDVMRRDVELVRADETTDAVIESMRKGSLDSAIVVDSEDQLIGYVSLEAVQKNLIGYVSLEAVQKNPNKKVGDIANEIIASTEVEGTMKDAFSEMLSLSLGYMPVLGEGDKVVGIITAGDAQRLIQTTE
jgi:osmoprotectant transport system ATP-binding protein